MFIALDIGGTHARMALFTENPEIANSFNDNFVKLAVLDMRNNYKKDLELLKNTYYSWKKEFENSDKKLKLKSGAAGIAGAFSVDNKRLIKSVHLNSWQNQDLQNDFEEIFNCSFVFRNDTFMAVAGAIALRNQSGDFWYINWGTGIGGALAIDLEKAMSGSLLKKGNKDWHYQVKPSEIGHASICKDGLICSCGQTGCWDAYCAGGQLEKRFNKHLSELTLSEWRPVFNDMAQGIINLYVSYPTPIIIMNGGVIQHETDKLDLLQELIRNKLKIFAIPPRIIILDKGDVSGLIGSWLVAAGILS
jgi:glucokinase